MPAEYWMEQRGCTDYRDYSFDVVLSLAEQLIICILNLSFWEMRWLHVNDTLLQQFREFAPFFSVMYKEGRKSEFHFWDVQGIKNVT
jgi:hypothetical protein